MRFFGMKKPFLENTDKSLGEVIRELKESVRKLKEELDNVKKQPTKEEAQERLDELLVEAKEKANVFYRCPFPKVSATECLKDGCPFFDGPHIVYSFSRSSVFPSGSGRVVPWSCSLVSQSKPEMFL